MKFRSFRIFGSLALVAGGLHGACSNRFDEDCALTSRCEPAGGTGGAAGGGISGDSGQSGNSAGVGGDTSGASGTGGSSANGGGSGNGTGAGAPGAAGGGGAGGISVGILYEGPEPTTPGRSFSAGEAGEGGVGGDDASTTDDGVPGASQERLSLWGRSGSNCERSAAEGSP